MKTECGEEIERGRDRERVREDVAKTVIEAKGEMKVVWSIQPSTPFMFLQQRDASVTGTSKA